MITMSKVQQDAYTSQMNWACLREPETRQKFQIALSNKSSVLEQVDNTDEAEKELSKTILECATSLCPPIKHRIQPWISDKCIHLVEKWKCVNHTNFEQYQ